jgi:hypothetical protein
LTINLPKPSFAGGWRREAIVPLSGTDNSRRDGSDLPLPRWGVFKRQIFLHEPPLAAVLRAVPNLFVPGRCRVRKRYAAAPSNKNQTGQFQVIQLQACGSRAQANPVLQLLAH